MRVTPIKLPVALSDKDAVVFVIKKQKDVLTKLKDWLVSLNADPSTGKIDIPMLMIDDEADNASINTSKSKEDPTTINRLIRELASIFTKQIMSGLLPLLLQTYLLILRRQKRWRRRIYSLKILL